MVVAAQQALGKNRAPSITSRTTKRPWLRESLGTMEWIAESTGSAEKPLTSTGWEVSPEICCDNLPASFWIHKPLDFLCQICLVIFCLYIIHCTYYNTLLLFSSWIFPKCLANLDVVSPFGGYVTGCHSLKDSWFCGFQVEQVTGQGEDYSDLVSQKQGSDLSAEHHLALEQDFSCTDFGTST